MSDSRVFDFYNKKHIENRPLHYDEMPTFLEIINTLKNFLDKL